jgi:hypothetical protein
MSKPAFTVEELTKRAMELTPEQRALLAEDLIKSLDAQTLSAIDRRWIAEAQRRRDEIRSSYSQSVPGPQALQQVRDAIKK